MLDGLGIARHIRWNSCEGGRKRSRGHSRAPIRRFHFLANEHTDPRHGNLEQV